jgi:integrase
MDKRASELFERGYAESTLSEKLCEWVDFATRYKNCDLPTCVRSAEVVAYLDERCANRGDGHVGVRASLRQFLHEDANEVRRLSPVSAPTTSLYDAVVPGYFVFLRHHRGRRVTSAMSAALTQFFDFLDERNVTSVGAITLKDVREFLASLDRLKRSSVAQYTSILRCFLRYEHMMGEVDSEMYLRIESPIIYRKSRPPELLSEDTIEQILSAVDRSTPLGKRDFGILLLAVRYGLRPSDIRTLRLGFIRRLISSGCIP